MLTGARDLCFVPNVLDTLAKGRNVLGVDHVKINQLNSLLRVISN